MKMEHSLTAPVDGVVELLVAVGDQSQRGHRRPMITATKNRRRRTTMTDFPCPPARCPDEYEQLARRSATSARDVVAPVARQARRRALLPYEVVAGMADGAVRPALPRSTAAWAVTTSRLSGPEELRQDRPERGHHPEAGVACWARCRCTGSAPRRRSGNGCPLLTIRRGARRVRPDGGRRWPPTPVPPRPPPNSTTGTG